MGLKHRLGVKTGGKKHREENEKRRHAKRQDLSFCSILVKIGIVALLREVSTPFQYTRYTYTQEAVN